MMMNKPDGSEPCPACELRDYNWVEGAAYHHLIAPDSKAAVEMMARVARVSFLGPSQTAALGLFGKVVRDGWQSTPYQVGSSLRDGEIPRDIDVRVMIPLAEFRQRFPLTNPDRRHVCEQWRAQMMVWSEWGRHLTGLIIDFQVEPEEDADARFPTEERRPIGGRMEKPQRMVEAQGVTSYLTCLNEEHDIVWDSNDDGTCKKCKRVFQRRHRPDYS